ncbi:transporter substrate-binding domain-containing protein [Clostridium sp. SHJSY1]|uniref:substrate-binding periplasmic protein n=1 Tax=Clostridium sp. SHJSY1 TaxID=2942483 RepID=UPI00287450AE|nr:transporter substrate-binding domain-containing protein [Clostridium sp. SHJSY1]MDS0525244.1 transporter substrate-binding domain-containing protein [Clostridium sp. SHJSY1]
MKSFFKYLVFFVVILNLVTNMTCFAIEVPNENNKSIQTIDRLQKIKEKGEITVLSFNIEPYSYRDPKTGEFSGVDSEIIKELSKRLGVQKVVVKYISLSNALQELANDPNIDLVAQAISITDERKKLAAFTNPIYTQNEVVVTRKKSNINSKEGLKNRIIGVLAGTVHESIAGNWKKKGAIKDYITFYDNRSLIVALENKTIDVMITEHSIGENILQSKSKSDFILLSPEQYKSEAYFNAGYPLKKEDITLLNAINENLQEMKKDGTMYQIFSKYGLTEKYVLQ